MTDHQKNYQRRIRRIEARIANGEPHAKIALRVGLTPERIRQIAKAMPTDRAPVAASAVRRPTKHKAVPSHPATTPVTKRALDLATNGLANAKDIKQARFSLEDVTAALAFGRVSEILKSIARQAGVSEPVLARRVGALLSDG